MMHFRQVAVSVLMLSLTSIAAAQNAKKEWVQKIIATQKESLENLGGNLAQQPAIQLLQAAQQAMPAVPEAKREAVAKAIQADVKKYLDETVPLVKNKAVAVAPSTMGAVLENKMSEEELKELANWLNSPTHKKFIQMQGELQQSLISKIQTDMAPAIDPKIQKLQQSIGKHLGVGEAPQPSKAPAKKK